MCEGNDFWVYRKVREGEEAVIHRFNVWIYPYKVCG